MTREQWWCMMRQLISRLAKVENGSHKWTAADQGLLESSYIAKIID